MAHPRIQALTKQIETFLQVTGRGHHRFGVLAAGNGRLVERLRKGGNRLTMDTIEAVEAYLAAADWTPRPPPKPRKPRRGVNT